MIKAVISGKGLSGTEVALNSVDLLVSPVWVICGMLLWKKKKFGYVTGLGMLFQGAIMSQSMVGLKMNVPAPVLDSVLALLPALRNPTVNDLADKSGYAIETVLQETIARTLIPELKRAGAEGIIEYPLNKVIP